jgi:hypothetical protein
MTVHFSTSPASPSPTTSSSDTQATAAAERTEVINMKSKDESAILAKLVELTKAKAIKTSSEDIRLRQELEEQEAASQKIKTLMRTEIARRKHEQDLLVQARGEAEALKSDV